ncbi:hypothetical protein D918_03732 [Trichuris suis]|nr:hypothetical protein D918_03732 [Trichuris suis]
MPAHPLAQLLFSIETFEEYRHMVKLFAEELSHNIKHIEIAYNARWIKNWEYAPLKVRLPQARYRSVNHSCRRPVSSANSSDEKNNKTRQVEIMVLPSLDVSFPHQMEIKEETDLISTSHDPSRSGDQSVDESIPIAVLSFNETVIVGAINYTLKLGNWSSEVHKSEPKNISKSSEHVAAKNITITEVPEKTIDLLAKGKDNFLIN